MANELSEPKPWRTRTEWFANVTTNYAPPAVLRRTSIVCTIGPATNSVEGLKQLRDAGMNVVRMNCSHAGVEYVKSIMDNTREVERRYPGGRPLAIALDTKGPEIRTGTTVDMKDYPVKAGQELIVTTNEQYKEKCDNKVVYVDYKRITAIMKKGGTIFIDDGILAAEVIEVTGDSIRCRVMNDGNISPKKSVNLPDQDVDLPALSEKDKVDIMHGAENGIHMIFASFIRCGNDVKAIRTLLGEKYKDIAIVAKIENRQGVNNFDEILEEVDAIMVARGDLGIECPAEELFTLQKMMIAKCNMAGKPCIAATQLLESMTYNPRPTRAEVSDVGNAVMDGANLVMLSGETTKGLYPNETVGMMARICGRAESGYPYRAIFDELRAILPTPMPTTQTCAVAAVSASFEQRAGAVVVLTTTGTSARYVAQMRPQCPIIVVTRNERTARVCHLYSGAFPFVYPVARPPDFSKHPWQEDVDARLKWGIEQGIELGLLKRGATVIAVQGWRGGQGNTSVLRIVRAEKDLGLKE